MRAITPSDQYREVRPVTKLYIGSVQVTSGYATGGQSHLHACDGQTGAARLSVVTVGGERRNAVAPGSRSTAEAKRRASAAFWHQAVPWPIDCRLYRGCKAWAS
jgi:hypothetical protein